MAKIIVGIHGLGNKPNPALLEQWWLQSIHEGLSKSGFSTKSIPFKLVYWADILHSEPENLNIKDKDNPLFISEPYIPSNNLPVAKPDPDTLSRKILKYIEGQLDNIFLKDDMTINFSSVTDRIIHSYFKDLEIYYSNENATKNGPASATRSKIRERLTKILKQYYNDDILLICHSMGSIISYDVLINHLNECRVNKMVTIGSPLGIPIIVSRIFAEQKSLLVPKNISDEWINLSDPEDLVAMDHTLEDDFAINENGIKIHDIIVFNDYIVNGKRNPHKVYGYLRTAEMAHIINDFLIKEESVLVRYYQNLKSKVFQLLEKTKMIRRLK